VALGVAIVTRSVAAHRLVLHRQFIHHAKAVDCFRGAMPTPFPEHRRGGKKAAALAASLKSYFG